VIFECEIRKNMHAASSGNGIFAFSYEHYVKGRGLFTPPFFVEARGGEDLEGPAEIENLHFGKNKDADGVLHCYTSVLEGNPKSLNTEDTKITEEDTTEQQVRG
jgi:hypothetical protein